MKRWTAYFLMMACAACSSSSPQRDASPTEIAQVEPSPFETAVSVDATAEQLAGLVGDARVVVLGEQSHGDGATFEAKTLLVKTLHEGLDFDVLLFESDLFGCAQLSERVAAADTPLDEFKSCIFGVWTASAELRPMWDYLAARIKAGDLVVAGFDPKLSSKFTQTNLLATLDAVEGASWQDAWKPLRPRIDELLGDPRTFVLDDETEARLQTLVDVAPQGQELVVASLLAHARSTFALNSMLQQYGMEIEQKASPAELNNLRDSQMAANVAGLLDGRFAGKKVIVWTASAHAAYTLAELNMEGFAPDHFAGAVSLGGELKRLLGDDLYTIGFTAGGGTHGFPWGQASTLEPPGEPSFESAAAATGLSNHIVDLTSVEVAGSKTFAARPIGHVYGVAPWGNVFDALVFQSEMRPSTKPD